MIIELSFESLTTSISNSFQPNNDSSISTSCIGLALRPFSISFLKSSILYATDPPVPPSVKEGLIITGKPMLSIKFDAFSWLLTNPPLAVGILYSIIDNLNFSLFSAFSIEFIFAPINFTLYFFRIFFL